VLLYFWFIQNIFSLIIAEEILLIKSNSDLFLEPTCTKSVLPKETMAINPLITRPIQH